MKKLLFTLLNPVQWVKAYRFNKQNSKFDKSSYDLELYLYSQILRNDMLHYGFFENPDIDPETISVKSVEDAQIKYSQNIIDLIENKEAPILDVGCGMGGLSALLSKEGYQVEALTPNVNQTQHITAKYPSIPCHNMKFEDFQTSKKFGSIINSESLQYIRLDDAFANIDRLLDEGGKWIIVDYFRTNDDGVNKSGHLFTDFVSRVNSRNWKIVSQRDITPNVLPTVKFLNMYAERFLLPLKHFAFEKLRYKKGWLYYLTKDMRSSIDAKIEKELAAIRPDKFMKEKKYLLIVVSR